MVKKGILEEIFSKALHFDDPSRYFVFFRDLDDIRKLSLIDFIKESNNFETIPQNRITAVMKNGKILFRRSKK